MIKKKKGFSLVFTLVVIMLLGVLTTSILSLAYSSFVNSKNVESSNKLKLVAEAGIERGMLALKEYILDHSNALVDPTKMNPIDVGYFEFTENGITCRVTFGPDITQPPDPKYPNHKYLDKTTGRNVDFIIIHARAEEVSSGRKREIEVIAEKKSVYNVYFERIFRSNITVVPKSQTTPDNNSLVITANSFISSGSIYSQARHFTLEPSTFIMDEGNIFKKGGENIPSTFQFPVSSSGKLINLYKEDGSGVKPGWQDVSIRPITVLSIVSKDSEDPTDIQKFNDPENQDIDNGYIDIKQSDEKDDSGNTMHPATLITYKAKVEGTSTPLNFKKLVDGKDLTTNTSGIYKFILDELKADDPTNYLTKYGTFYKLVLIDGNLDISDVASINFNNYIIYCTGRVTLNGNVQFFNSSIFANEVIATDTTANIVFNGVNTYESKQHDVYGYRLTDFNSWDKAIIDNYLVNNVDEYGDYLQFKTLEWKEY